MRQVDRLPVYLRVHPRQPGPTDQVVFGWEIAHRGTGHVLARSTATFHTGEEAIREAEAVGRGLIDICTDRPLRPVSGAFGQTPVPDTEKIGSGLP